MCLVYTFKCSLPLKDTGNSNVLVSFLVRLILPKPYALILIFALHHFIFPKREKRPLDHSVALPLADVNFQVYSNFCVSLDLYVCSSLVLRSACFGPSMVISLFNHSHLFLLVKLIPHDADLVQISCKRL